MKFFKLISFVPLFALVLLLYHILVLAGVNFVGASSLINMPLPSEAAWQLTWSDLFIVLGVFTLFIEIVKSTSTGTASIVDHALSMIVFIAFLMDFLFFKSAGTSAFLIVTLMSLLDVVAGFTITVASARRDFAMGG